MHMFFSRLLLISGFYLLLSVSTTYAEGSLPTPLDLKTALSFADSHPRTKLSLEQQVIYPPKQPLFLNCHDLAFNNTSTIDNQRNNHLSLLVSPTERQKLAILQAYFDVLLADSSFIGINEDMAGAFIAYDRAKTREEYKQYSELKVAKLEAEYQAVRQQFFSGEATQRITRAVLAQTINHPNELSSELNPPQLIQIPKELPGEEKLYSAALKNNNWLNALEEDNNDEQNALLKMSLHQQILELLQRIKVLKIAQERAESESNHRDLALELSRTLYEMEVKASLGRSMTMQSKARMEEERIRYCQTLAWAELNALTGQANILAPAETLSKLSENTENTKPNKEPGKVPGKDKQ